MKELGTPRTQREAHVIRRAILEESFDSIREAVVRGRVDNLPRLLHTKLQKVLADFGVDEPQGAVYIKEVFEIVRTFNTYMIAETTKAA